MNSLNNLISLKLDSMVDPICHIIDKNTKTILDVGCGPGYPMKLIKMTLNLDRVVGVDLFKKYIKQAKKEKIHDEYVIADIREMRFEPKSFDVVLASHVIEHLPEKDALKFIKDLERIAKKQVIIATPIGEHYHPAVDNNKLQLHLSHFYPKDFENLGYKTIKYGRKSLLAEEGIVHKIKIDPLKKLIFLFNILISPLYYRFPSLADYVFVAYKKIK
jgi:ubiquinone/menaquinone biosynthesis C-methylase UbiE